MVRGEELATTIAKRHDFVDALLSEPMGKPELVAATDTSRSTVDRAVDELESLGLIVRENGRYRPTFTGKVAFTTFEGYRERLDEIERAREVVGVLPPDASLDVDALVGATVTPTEPHAFGYPVQQTLDAIDGADRMRGVSSAVTPQFVETVHDAVVEGGLELDLVLTPQVCETVATAHREEFEALFDAATATLYRAEEPADYAVWTVDDADGTTSCVVVFTEAGVEGVVVNDTDAMNDWATDVFETYRDRATELDSFPPSGA